MTRINSRAKGQRFERLIAGTLAELWPDAKRGFQGRSGSDAPDVDGTPWWIECKHGASPHVGKAMVQALRAKDSRPAVVIARKDRGTMLALVEHSTFDARYTAEHRSRAGWVACYTRTSATSVLGHADDAAMLIVDLKRYPPMVCMTLRSWMRLEQIREGLYDG